MRPLLREGARPRRPPPHRHGVARRARDHDGPDLRAARRGRVPRGAVGRARAAGVPARVARAARPHPRLGARVAARAAARGAAREGRLLGPRDRRGAPARLGGAGVRGQGGLRPQLRGAHAPPARRAAGRARGDRLAQPALRVARDRLQPPHGRRGSRPRAAGAARPRRRAAATRSPRRASACACTARWATSWRAWRTSCAACSRTPPTSRSCTSRRAACRSRSCWRRREAVRQRAHAGAAPRARARVAARRAARARPAAAARGAACWSGASAGAHEGFDSTDPGEPERVVATRRPCRPRRMPRAPWRPPRRRSPPGATLGASRARRGARRRRGDPALAPPRAGRAAGARVREAVARGGRRRVRGDRLPRVLRARGAAARRTGRSCCRCRASATRCATSRAACAR